MIDAVLQSAGPWFGLDAIAADWGNPGDLELMVADTGSARAGRYRRIESV